MASTAAWSAASRSPRPIPARAARAAASVTRTSSNARLRSIGSRISTSPILLTLLGYRLYVMGASVQRG
jgi:hypothetical protein